MIERSKRGDLHLDLRQLWYVRDTCGKLVLRHTPRVQDFLHHGFAVRFRLIRNEPQRTPLPHARLRIGRG